MRIVCQWTHPAVVIGEKEPLSDNRVTHGLCASCRSKLLEEMQELNLLLDKTERKQFIEKLEGKIPQHFEFM